MVPAYAGVILDEYFKYRRGLGGSRIRGGDPSIAIRINKDKSIFVPLKAWNGTATLLSDYSSKGHRIGISGSIDIDTFESEDKSKLNYFTYVLVDSVTFCERKDKL